jgi:hypothetical protein
MAALEMERKLDMVRLKMLEWKERREHKTRVAWAEDWLVVTCLPRVVENGAQIVNIVPSTKPEPKVVTPNANNRLPTPKQAGGENVSKTINP